jgi:hypothetical protein
MYPDWPQPSADLVPLPLCDGPKLKPFDIQGGGQAIEFLDYLGEGSHARVFKVQILGKIYALKLVGAKLMEMSSMDSLTLLWFRFVDVTAWRNPRNGTTQSKKSWRSRAPSTTTRSPSAASAAPSGGSKRPGMRSSPSNASAICCWTKTMSARFTVASPRSTSTAK